MPLPAIGDVVTYHSFDKDHSESIQAAVPAA